MIKKCVICGRQFKAFGYTKTCSKECRAALYSQTFKERWASILGSGKEQGTTDMVVFGLNYLAQLEKKYGHPDDGTIRAMINSWGAQNN